MKDTLVVGLGNPLMGDEGVGLRVLEKLEERADSYPDVEFMDLGTGGMTLVHAMAGRSRVILIDCAFMDEPPGTLRRFTPEQVRSRKPRLRQGLHGGDLLELLELSDRLGELPADVVIFGIQPVDISPRRSLGQELRDRLHEYADRVAAELMP